MNQTNNYKFTPGCKEFQSVPVFALGANTFDYSNSYKLTVNKTDNTNAAISLFDLGYLKHGSRVVFEIEGRTISGTGATITLESRNDNANLISGRAICSSDVLPDAATSTDWTNLRAEWIVTEKNGNFISATIAAATLSIGKCEFRNPQIRIYEGDKRLGNIYACNLLRSSNVWTVDNVNFNNLGGFKVTTGSGNDLVLSFKEVEGMLPVPIVSVDGGWPLPAAGFLFAAAHTVTKNSMKISLIKADGTKVADVSTGDTVRVNVALIFP